MSFKINPELPREDGGSVAGSYNRITQVRLNAESTKLSVDFNTWFDEIHYRENKPPVKVIIQNEMEVVVREATYDKDQNELTPEEKETRTVTLRNHIDFDYDRSVDGPDLLLVAHNKVIEKIYEVKPEFNNEGISISSDLVA